MLGEYWGYDQIGRDAERQEASAAEQAGERELRDLAEDAVRAGLGHLDAIEAYVIEATFGLWGRHHKTLDQVARTLGGTRDEVRRAKADALAKIRDHLEETGHPAIDTL